jgi:hypothetical protein
MSLCHTMPSILMFRHIQILRTSHLLFFLVDRGEVLIESWKFSITAEHAVVSFVEVAAKCILIRRHERNPV